MTPTRSRANIAATCFASSRDPSANAPAPPENYLAPESEARIASLIARARPANGDALLQALRPELLAPAAAAWRTTAEFD